MFWEDDGGDGSWRRQKQCPGTGGPGEGERELWAQVMAMRKDEEGE